MILAFAAGALLVILYGSIVPVTSEHSGNESGLLPLFGIAVAMALSLAYVTG
jgi:zinc transporter ZupT